MHNPDNFATLDGLLERLERPPHPAIDESGRSPFCFAFHGSLDACDKCEAAWAHNGGRWPPPCEDEHGRDEYCEKCHAKRPEENVVDHSEQIKSELTELMEEGMEDDEEDEDEGEFEAEDEDVEEDEEDDVF